MMILPVAVKLNKWGLGKGLSVLIADLLIVGFFVGLFFLIAAQIDSIMDDWPKIKERVKPKIEQLQQYVQNKIGISEEQQVKEMEQLFNSGSSEGKQTGSGTQGAAQALKKAFGTFGDLLLIFVYIFFFLFYRKKLSNTLLRLAPKGNRDHTRKVIHQASQIAQQYLFGRFILILFLAVLYAVGFSISGVRNAILIAIIAAVLSLIPYIGNVIGAILALAMTFLTGGGLPAIIGVLITFTIVQFVESYILEPYVVGHKVDLNPVVTIIVVVLGGAMWGLVGMLLSIPVLGILKVIFDNVKVLKPLGYGLDERDLEGGSSWFDSVENWFQKKFRSG
jgi:predicted PurR-regulated permease PerM